MNARVSRIDKTTQIDTMPTNHANLLPAAWLRRSLIRLRLRQWCVVWMLAIAGLATACGTQYWLCRHSQSAIAKLEQQIAPLRDQLTATNDIRTRLDELRSRESLLATLEATGEPLELVGIVSQSASTAAGDLRIDHLTLKTTSRQVELAAAGAQPAETKTRTIEQIELALEGSATNDLAVTRFEASLRGVGVFDVVQLKSLDGTDSRGPRQFHIACSYEK